MTKIFEKNENEFYDDYAHHPTEIYSVLEGIKKVANEKKITSVFQPHRFSRVNLLKKEFSKSFKAYLKNGDKFLIDCCKQHISSIYGRKSEQMKAFKSAVSKK